MAYPSPRRLQLRRGNASAISSYLGYAGELVVDTSNWTLYVHDGVTVGGYAATVNTASISGNINSILNGTAVFGNIIPSANAVYSLGNITHQWKSLFVSNSTIYVGGVPLSIDTTGNLTVNGNIIPTIAYVNASVANVTVDLSAYALNANVTAANVGLKGYVDQANTIQSAQVGAANLAITAANVGLKGYVDQANTIQSAQITAANVGMKGYVDSQTYSNINVSTYLASHIDQTIGGNLTIQGNLTVNGNVTYISVNNIIIDDNIIQLANFNTADSLDLGVVAHRTPSGQPMQHTGLIRDASANQWRLFSNVVTPPGTTVDFTDAIYDDLQLGNVTSTGNITATYFIGYTQGLVGSITNLDSLNFSVENISALVAGNGVNIGAGGNNNLVVLPTEVMIQNVPLSVAGNIISTVADGLNLRSNHDVNIAANITGSTATWNFGTDGRLAFPGTPVIDTDANNFDVIGAESVSLEANAAVNIYTDTGGATYQWQFNNSGNLKLPNGGYILNSDDSIYGGGSSYGNTQVATYLQSGNIANVSVAGNVTAAYFLGNGALLTGIVGGAGNYGNVDVKAYLATEPGDYQRLIQGYYANLDLGATAELYSFGGTSKSYFGHDGYQGDPGISTVIADNYFIKISTYNGAYNWTFDNTGNLTLPGNIAAINYANGTPVTFSSSSYSNVQVAAYLNTQGYNLYSNVNVANYLTTATITTTGNITAGNLITGGAFYVANITTTGASGNISGANYITANVILTNGGWGNISQVANIQANAVLVSGNVTATYFLGNGALLTGIVASGSNYSNANVAAYLTNYDGDINFTSSVAIISNVDVITVLDHIRSPSYQYSNGVSILSGLGYSNVQVATYLPTYSGNIANIRLGVAGVLTFADGTTQITAGGGSYSNVQVGAYLTTGVNTAAPQIQLTNATSNYIRYSNVGVGVPTFTTSSLGTRVIYWPSVDATTADYAVGIDAGVLWHGIPRATSGFAFKWYAGNTQIAMLEGTGSFTIANIRLSPSGNIVFADGTVQTTAATGTYSNIQVATYLPTYTGSLNASNILVTSANITIANIQATTAATNTATGALRVMGGVGVAGAVVAGQLNSTGNVVANAISAYSLNTVANVVASVVNAGTINSAGNVLAQNLTGTLTTASQTNITAVGTLTTLSVTGNATVGNLVGTEANTRIIANVYITTFDIYGNVSFPGNITTSSSGYFMGNALGTTAAYTGNVTVGGNLTIIGTKSNVPVKTGGFVAQNTAVSIDSITAQWLNTGAASANQLQLAALNGNVSILYTYTFQDGTGGSTTGGSSSTTLANLSFGWTSIGNPSGVAGDMYNVLVTLPGTNAYRITAMTGSGYSDNVLTVERLI